MQNSTKIKLILKKILPSFLFTFIKNIWSNNIIPIQDYVFKLRINDFIKPEFVNLNFKNINFDLLIDPSNGLVDTSIYAKRKYEHHILTEMYAYIKIGNVALDIGANIGHHSIFMAKIVGGGGEIYAFEPIPKIYNQLEKSVTKNNLNNVIINKYALGEIDKEVEININNNNVGGSSIVNRNASDTTTNVKIQVKTLDSLNLQKVDFIKLDVEGYEWNVIAGGADTISKYKPTIIFEYSPDYFRRANNNDGNKILNFMINNNYIMYDLENKKKMVADIKSFEKEFAPGLRSQTNLLCVQQ